MPLEGFVWRHDRRYGNYWLHRTSDDVVVVCITERNSGGYAVQVNRHLWPIRGFPAPNLSRAKAWAEAYCRVHRERLQVEPQEPFGGWGAQKRPQPHKAGISRE